VTHSKDSLVVDIIPVRKDFSARESSFQEANSVFIFYWNHSPKFQRLSKNSKNGMEMAPDST
jgi:hypothetical protein